MTARRRDRPSQDNSGENSGVAPGVMVPQPHGGALLRGGPRPNAGRPPGTFREFLRTIREDDATLRAAIEKAASDPESRAFGHVLKLVSAYDEDGPDPRVAVSEVSRRLHAQMRLLRDRLPSAQADEICAALVEVWR